MKSDHLKLCQVHSITNLGSAEIVNQRVRWKASEEILKFVTTLNCGPRPQVIVK